MTTFQYETTANLINGLTVSLEAAKQFAHNAKYDHDTVKSICNVVADLRAEKVALAANLTLREGEVAMLKELLADEC